MGRASALPPPSAASPSLSGSGRGALRLEGDGGAQDREGEGEELDGVPVDEAGAVDVAAAPAAMLEQQRQRGEGEEAAGGGPEDLGGGNEHRPASGRLGGRLEGSATAPVCRPWPGARRARRGGARSPPRVRSARAWAARLRDPARPRRPPPGTSPCCAAPARRTDRRQR